MVMVMVMVIVIVMVIMGGYLLYRKKFKRVI